MPRNIKPGETLEWGIENEDITARWNIPYYENLKDQQGRYVQLRYILALAREALEARNHRCDNCRWEGYYIDGYGSYNPCSTCCHNFSSFWEAKK